MELSINYNLIRHYIIVVLFVFLSYSTLNLQDRLKRISYHVMESAIHFEKEFSASKNVSKIKKSLQKQMSIQRHQFKKLQNLFISISLICFIYILVLFSIKEIPLIIRLSVASSIVFFLILKNSGVQY